MELDGLYNLQNKGVEPPAHTHKKAVAYSNKLIVKLNILRSSYQV